MAQRVAVVTGGMGGLGVAICTKLAKIGYRVVATHSPGNKKWSGWLAEMKTQAYDFHAAEVDVADFDSCQRAVGQIQSEVGPIDVLVNNAGITRDTTFHRMTAQQWNEVIATNLGSVFNVTRPVIDGMRGRKWGRIIQISSINGQKGQYGQANYAASKAGMHGFTISLAQENARFGITVNTVSPGYIGTDMVMAVPEDVRNKIIQQIPTGRLGNPEEIAYAVSFFIPDEAGWITGANLAVNGGQYMGW